MMYTDALRKLYEVFEERPDIKKVEFEKDNESFIVITDSGIHRCFCDEFKDKDNSTKDTEVIKIDEKTKLLNTFIDDIIVLGPIIFLVILVILGIFSVYIWFIHQICK